MRVCACVCVKSHVGESIPVRKTAYDIDLDGLTYNQDTFNHCTLFNGTVVSALRKSRGGRPPVAIVAATGFNTAKVRVWPGIRLRLAHTRTHDSTQLLYSGRMYSIVRD